MNTIHHEVEQSSAVNLSPSPAQEKAGNKLTFNGKAWVLQFEGKSVSAPDSIGLHYIKQLIQCATEEIHVTDLVTSAYGEAEEITEEAALLEDDVAIEFQDEQSSDAPNGRVVTTEFRDEILSDKDRAFVLRLLENENKRLAQLEKKGLPFEVLAKREEIKAIEKYLEDHRFGSQNVCFENRGSRDRASVKNAITRTLKEIKKVHPALAQHLRVSIRTGYHCAYAPAVEAACTT
jgi:hypothetical protein